MTVRVLADWHHHALAESLLLLMEDRYGWEVYFPAGMEWYDEEVWQFEKAVHGDAVARQYLVGIWAPDASSGPIRLRPDPRHPPRVHKGIELAPAREMRWDLVVSTLPHNDVGLAAFARQTGARFVVQVGNHLQDSRWDLADAILSSSTLPGLGPERAGEPVTFRGKPCVIYRQEFSLDVFRHEWPPAERRTVASFVNCFPETHPYPDFLAFARAYHQGFDFRVYGAYGSAPRDELAAGNLSLVTDVADAMRGTRTAWHQKSWSDGFGHVIHDWFAIGRPVVGVARYYADKLAGPLWSEGVTSFDIEGLSYEAVADILRRLRDDDELHRRMSEAAAARFREVVDFDGEAAVIKGMLEGVLS